MLIRISFVELGTYTLHCPFLFRQAAVGKFRFCRFTLVNSGHQLGFIGGIRPMPDF